MATGMETDTGQTTMLTDQKLPQINRLQKRLSAKTLPGDSPHFAQLAAELQAYFSGSRSEFAVPLVTPGTQFQTMVWEELRNIPFGETRTYAQQAANIGHPTAVRAVARANGDNRIAIVIPCHRVIGADGSLTGYGGGLWRKKRLLEIERASRFQTERVSGTNQTDFTATRLPVRTDS